MRKLVFILIAFIAAVTFIRAFDNTSSQSADVFEAMAPIDPEYESYR
jgi:hypothetical protein